MLPKRQREEYFSVVLVHPFGKKPAVFLRTVDESHVPGPVQKLPTGVWYAVEHGLCQQWSALVVCAIDNQARRAYLMKTGCIIEVS